VPLPFSNAGKGARGAVHGRWRSSNEAAELAEFAGLRATKCAHLRVHLRYGSQRCVLARHASFHTGTQAHWLAKGQHMQLNTCSRARESARCAKRGVLLQLKLGGQAGQTGGGKTFAATSQGTGRAGARGRRIEGCEQRRCYATGRGQRGTKQSRTHDVKGSTRRRRMVGKSGTRSCCNNHNRAATCSCHQRCRQTLVCG
jgi:hypothetical protein